MGISFPDVPRYVIPILIVVASLAVVGCRQGDTADLEARVAELERQLEAEQQRTTTLTTAMASSRTSVFDSPLSRFFAAPEFWEVVYEDTGACHNRCYTAFEQQMDACQDADDVDACELQAAEETVACHAECEPDGLPVVP